MTPRITIPTEAIAEFCKRWKITEMALFGSVLREDFGPDSDVDVMVVFEPEAHPTLISVQEMEAELGSILGRSVDLVTRLAIERSPLGARRSRILEHAQVLYAA